MHNEWIEDSFRQWHLGLLAAGLAAVLESEAKATRDCRLHRLARQVEDGVLSPLREPEWVQGLTESVEALAPQCAKLEDVAGRITSLASALRSCWLSAFPARLGELSGEPGPAAGGRLGAVFRECLKIATVARPEGEAPSRVPTPGGPSVEAIEPVDAARTWIGMARAVSAWPAVLGGGRGIRRRPDR